MKRADWRHSVGDAGAQNVDAVSSSRLLRKTRLADHVCCECAWEW